MDEGILAYVIALLPPFLRYFKMFIMQNSNHHDDFGALSKLWKLQMT